MSHRVLQKETLFEEHSLIFNGAHNPACSLNCGSHDFALFIHTLIKHLNTKDLYRETWQSLCMQ